MDRIDALLAEYNEKHPNQITSDIVSGFLADKPLIRKDQGKDFIEFTLERLASDYSRNRIGRSRYENGKSCMNILELNTLLEQLAIPSIRNLIFAVADTLIGGQPIPISSDGGSSSDLPWDGSRPDEEVY